jgi:hypothetical protein
MLLSLLKLGVRDWGLGPIPFELALEIRFPIYLLKAVLSLLLYIYMIIITSYSYSVINNFSSKITISGKYSLFLSKTNVG